VVRLEAMTRREIRDALDGGRVRAAILPVGSIEQHLEHLAMGHDIASSTYVAEAAARRLFPQVVVAVPMAIGMAEHHMVHRGSLSAKPGAWLSVLWDAVESVIRAGIPNVLILNGHGGNVAPARGAINQLLRYFDVERTNVHFQSYWDLIPESLWRAQLATGRLPGHAQEFETSFALAVFPQHVRADLLDNEPESAQGTREKGQALAASAVDEVTEYVRRMIDGRRRAEITGL
jgi:creatinine amidohydrolase